MDSRVGELRKHNPPRFLNGRGSRNMGQRYAWAAKTGGLTCGPD